MDKKSKEPNKLKNTKSVKKEKDSKDSYVFKNFYESETQLNYITHTSDPEEILKAFNRLIWVHASNHSREGVEIEDLVAEGQKGICLAIKDFNDPTTKKRNYNFQQACLYRMREAIYQYCLRNVSQIKTPYYIQRGCMHVGQIFKLMNNQSVAEDILKRKGPASEQDIINFIYNEKERLPEKSMRFIKKQITKDPSRKEFKQILDGILTHKLGSGHSYVKSNLTDVGKVLHIKEKLHYTIVSNGMNYERVVGLVLSARQSKVELNTNIYSPKYDNVELMLQRKEMLEHGKKVCGEKEFEIFIQNKVFDKTYDELATLYRIKKIGVIEVIKECIRKLRKDKQFQDMFKLV